MDQSLKIWVLSGVVLVVGSVLIFLAKWFFTQALKVLEEIKDELKTLTHVTTIQDVKIENLIKATDQNTERLNRHSNRIMDIEKQLVILNDKTR